MAPAGGGGLPIDDPVAVEEHQGRRDLGGVEAGAGLVELPGPLDLEHQVASVHVLHHKEQPVLQTESDGGRGRGREEERQRKMKTSDGMPWRLLLFIIAVPDLENPTF